MCREFRRTLQLAEFKSALGVIVEVSVTGVHIRCWVRSDCRCTDRARDRLPSRGRPQEDREARTCHRFPRRSPRRNRLHQPPAERVHKDNHLPSLFPSTNGSQPGLWTRNPITNNLRGLPHRLGPGNMERLNRAIPVTCSLVPRSTWVSIVFCVVIEGTSWRDCEQLHVFSSAASCLR